MKIIIENLKNPKRRAIVQLGIYFIFFMFVFIIIGLSDNKSNNKENEEYKVLKKDNEKVDIIENIDLYNYEYIFKINELEITGTFDDGENIFFINGIEYYSNNNSTYIYNTMEEVENFDIDKYSYKNVEKLIEQSEFVEKTIYKDNTEKITYNSKNETYCAYCTIIVESNNNIKKIYIGDNVELKYLF